MQNIFILFFVFSFGLKLEAFGSICFLFFCFLELAYKNLIVLNY